VTNSVPSSAERAYLKAGIGRDRLRVGQEIKGAPMNSWPAFVGLYRQCQAGPWNPPTQNSYR